MPLAGAVDNFMLVRLMKAYLPADTALSHYGIYAGLVISLINVPTALAMAMSSNLVPAISARRAAGDRQGIRRDTSAGLRLAVVIGLPSSIGMSLLAEPILTLLFHSKYTVEELRLGGQLLSISALTIVVFTLVQATSGILQGLYKQRIPMYTLFLGVLIKIAINYTAVQQPGTYLWRLRLLPAHQRRAQQVVWLNTDVRLEWKELLVRPVHPPDAVPVIGPLGRRCIPAGYGWGW